MLRLKSVHFLLTTGALCGMCGYGIIASIRKEKAMRTSKDSKKDKVELQEEVEKGVCLITGGLIDNKEHEVRIKAEVRDYNNRNVFKVWGYIYKGHDFVKSFSVGICFTETEAKKIAEKWEEQVQFVLDLERKGK